MRGRAALGRIAHEGRLLLCAVQFLTRLPTPSLTGFEPAWTTRAARWFPLVGQGVGLACAGVFVGAAQVWPQPLPALLAVAAGVLLTGGFHEDGLADTADGLGGGTTRAARLAIMKDSRLGSYGALALGLVTAGRVAALAALTPGAGALALVAAHGAGRGFAVAVMAALPYAGDPAAAKLKPEPGGVRRGEAAFALAWGCAPIFLLGWAHAALAVVLATAATLLLARAARRGIGGRTGDVLGAVEQAAELAVLFAAAAGLAA